MAVDALGEIDRGEQRAAPRSEVLRTELVPEVDLHVVVQALAGEVVDLALPLVLEDAWPLELEQTANRRGELRIDDLGADADAVLRGKGEADAAASHRDVATHERGHAVGPVANITLRADAKPAELDQPERDSGDALAIELLLAEMHGHSLAQRRQALSEPDQVVVLGLLLLGPKFGAVEVLLPA